METSAASIKEDAFENAVREYRRTSKHFESLLKYRDGIVAAAQSSTSFIPPLGAEKTRVLTLNLRNRLIFKAADEAGAVESADFLGQKKTRKVSYGYSGGTAMRNYTDIEEHKIKPYQLRNLRKHQCVLVHCEHGFCRALLPPLEPDGSVSKWFRR